MICGIKTGPFKNDPDGVKLYVKLSVRIPGSGLTAILKISVVFQTGHHNFHTGRYKLAFFTSTTNNPLLLLG